MFTGIVQETGIVEAVSHKPEGSALRIKATNSVRSLDIGGSICTQGVCLTCVEISADSFLVDVGQETLRKTTLGDLQPGDRINLELPLRLSDPLGGHLVQGHVDGVGSVEGTYPEGEGQIITFRAPREILGTTIEKGSITIDGVSLTVFNVTDQSFQVSLIPHTLNVTTLGELKPGDRVNLEADLVGKYVARLINRPVEEDAQ